MVGDGLRIWRNCVRHRLAVFTALAFAGLVPFGGIGQAARPDAASVAQCSSSYTHASIGGAFQVPTPRRVLRRPLPDDIQALRVHLLRLAGPAALMRGLLTVSAMLALAVVAPVSHARSYPHRSAMGATTMQPWVAQKLAIIQRRRPVRSNDPLVGKFSRAISTLRQRCGDTNEQLGNESVFAQAI